MTIDMGIADQLSPFVKVEFDPSKAQVGPLAQPIRGLVSGVKTSGATATDGVVYQVTSSAQAKTLFGAGSALHSMAQKIFDPTRVNLDVSFVSLAEPSGVKASGKITISSASTAAGTLALYIAGRQVPVTVGSGASANSIAGLIISAINADTSLPVTAVVDDNDANEVNITCKWKGLSGNDIDIRINYYPEDATPAGVTYTIAQLADGTLAPAYSGLNAILGDIFYCAAAFPDTDSGSMTSLKTMATDRGSATRMIDDMMFFGNAESVSTAGTLGNAHNSEFACITHVKASPTPSYDIAAAMLRLELINRAQDPAIGLQELVLENVLPPALADRATAEENEILLGDGITPTYVNANGKVAVLRSITTYKTNSSGGADSAYLDTSTIALLSRLRYDWRNRIATRFSRYKIADDGQPVDAGQKIITPSIGKAYCMEVFNDWLLKGWVENKAQFKSLLRVERNSTNRTRMDFYMPIDIINNLLQMATKLGVIL